MGSIFRFLAFFLSFYFFWIVFFFVDRLIFWLDFFDVFYPFFIDPFFGRFLSNVATVGRFLFFVKNPKKSKKIEKMTFFGVQKKGSKLVLFVPPPFLVKNRVFWPPNSPPSGY